MVKQHIILAFVFNDEHQICVAKRDFPKHMGGLWELPGGKVDEGESAFEALVRELEEEVAIKVVDAKPWCKFEHDYVDRALCLDCWVVDQYEGNVCGNEGQCVQWVDLDKLSQYEFPPANEKIIKQFILDFPY